MQINENDQKSFIENFFRIYYNNNPNSAIKYLESLYDEKKLDAETVNTLADLIIMRRQGRLLLDNFQIFKKLGFKLIPNNFILKLIEHRQIQVINEYFDFLKNIGISFDLKLLIKILKFDKGNYQRHFVKNLYDKYNNELIFDQNLANNLIKSGLTEFVISNLNIFKNLKIDKEFLLNITSQNGYVALLILDKADLRHLLDKDILCSILKVTSEIQTMHVLQKKSELFKDKLDLDIARILISKNQTHLICRYLSKFRNLTLEALKNFYKFKNTTKPEIWDKMLREITKNFSYTDLAFKFSKEEIETLRNSEMTEIASLLDNYIENSGFKVYEALKNPSLVSKICL